MLRLKTTFLFSFFWLLIGLSESLAQNVVLSDKTEISLLTCDSGNQLYSLFGHTALRVKDDANAIDAVYNYGYFDFRTPNFYLKFVKGDLQYFVAVDQFDAFLAEYVYDQRGVYEQRLNLTPIQKQKIFDELNAVLASDNRFYTYKFIDRNCTTMVADVINANISGKLSTQIEDSGKTYRTILYDYQKTDFWANLGINIMFGAKTDKQFDHPFLPLQLLESVKNTKNEKLPLANSVQVLNIKSAPETPFSFWNSFYPFVLFFIVLVAVNKQIVYLTYLTVAGFLGIFLFWAGFYSLHQELLLNYNILIFNPLLLVLLCFVLKNNRLWILRILYCCSGILLVYIIFMCTKPHFLLFLPFILTHVIFMLRVWKNTKQLPQ